MFYIKVVEYKINWLKGKKRSKICRTILPYFLIWKVTYFWHKYPLTFRLFICKGQVRNKIEGTKWWKLVSRDKYELKGNSWLIGWYISLLKSGSQGPRINTSLCMLIFLFFIRGSMCHLSALAKSIIGYMCFKRKCHFYKKKVRTFLSKMSISIG